MSAGLKVFLAIGVFALLAQIFLLGVRVGIAMSSNDVRETTCTATAVATHEVAP